MISFLHGLTKWITFYILVMAISLVIIVFFGNPPGFVYTIYLTGGSWVVESTNAVLAIQSEAALINVWLPYLAFAAILLVLFAMVENSQERSRVIARAVKSVLAKTFDENPDQRLPEIIAALQDRFSNLQAEREIAAGDYQTLVRTLRNWEDKLGPITGHKDATGVRAKIQEAQEYLGQEDERTRLLRREYLALSSEAQPVIAQLSEVHQRSDDLGALESQVSELLGLVKEDGESSISERAQMLRDNIETLKRLTQNPMSDGQDLYDTLEELECALNEDVGSVDNLKDCMDQLTDLENRVQTASTVLGDPAAFTIRLQQLGLAVAALQKADTKIWEEPLGGEYGNLENTLNHFDDEIDSLDADTTISEMRRLPDIEAKISGLRRELADAIGSLQLAEA